MRRPVRWCQDSPWRQPDQGAGTAAQAALQQTEYELRALVQEHATLREQLDRLTLWIRVHGGASHQWPGVVTEVAQVDAKSVPPQLSSRAARW